MSRNSLRTKKAIQNLVPSRRGTEAGTISVEITQQTSYDILPFIESLRKCVYILITCIVDI